MIQKIVKTSSKWEQHFGKSKTFTWWQTKVTTLTLECGHQKVYRGDSTPKSTAICKECSK